MRATPTKYFETVVKLLKKKKLYPRFDVISGPSSNPEVVINNKKYLTFCSNNYLGLATNPQAQRAVSAAIKRYGIGSGSTRLLSGTLDVQVEFEQALAEFYGYDAAITFSSGFLANIGTIRMLIDPFPYFSLPFSKPGVIFSDELNHASMIDAVRLARAERVIYRHNDMADLEQKLAQHKRASKLIITDGVFSMDGDFANLPAIAQLAKQYGALSFVDDSHGAGVLGPHGEGVAHHLGLTRDIDVIMASFTKAWGSIGGYIVTREQSIAEYLRITARSYIFSDPIPPAFVSGLLTTLELIKHGDALRHRTLANAAYLRSGLQRLGFEVLGDTMPIVPPLLHSEKNALTFADRLLNAGILAPAVRRPAVPVGAERLRLTTMATHTIAQIDYLLECMSTIGRSLKII